MNSFEKLFVNSTNRFSAVKNIILSQATSNFQPLQSNDYQNQSIQHKNSFLFGSSLPHQSNETFEQLQQKFQQLSKIVNEASREKEMMSMLFDKIFNVQQGEEERLKKRIRRKKNQIQSKFQCGIPNCNKIYSSSASLARHTKLKHAYCSSQPPQHNYQIPPSPNLKPSKQTSSGIQPQSVACEKDEKDDEEGDAKLIQSQDDFYEADCENSEHESEESEEIEEN